VLEFIDGADGVVAMTVSDKITGADLAVGGFQYTPKARIVVPGGR